MATKKRAKKRLPKPKACEALVLFHRDSGELDLSCWSRDVNDIYFMHDRDDDKWVGVCRVRIVPVVAKRRKGAK